MKWWDRVVFFGIFSHVSDLDSSVLYKACLYEKWCLNIKLVTLHSSFTVMRPNTEQTALRFINQPSVDVVHSFTMNRGPALWKLWPSHNGHFLRLLNCRIIIKILHLLEHVWKLFYSEWKKYLEVLLFVFLEFGFGRNVKQQRRN